MTRLLIVDDHVIVRQGLQQLFATVSGIEVVGVAEDGCQAVVQVDRLSPDVVLMDLEMPIVDGIEATRRITSVYPTSRVVILTASDDPSRIEDALRAGAVSYVPKHSDPSQVVRAVQAAHLPGARPGSAAPASAGPARRSDPATTLACGHPAGSASDGSLPLCADSGGA